MNEEQRQAYSELKTELVNVIDGEFPVDEATANLRDLLDRPANVLSAGVHNFLDKHFDIEHMALYEAHRDYLELVDQVDEG